LLLLGFALYNPVMEAGEKLFNDSCGLKLGFPEIIGEIAGFINREPEWRYKIITGTDSATLSDSVTDFVTVVVVHRIGNGGRYFWRRETLGKFHTLRDRMITEALMSVDAAKELLTNVKDASPSVFDDTNWDFEIHVDIGENGKTKTMIQEITNMVRANNFEVRVKPESYAASSVADRYA